jgi:hypothetical protein
MHHFSRVLRRHLSDGRSILYLGLFFFGEVWLAAQGDAKRMWERFHVPYLQPPFADTLTVLYSIDALNAGHDPYRYVATPFGNTYNYPRMWLELRHLGLAGEHTNLVGVLLATAFFVCFAALLPRLRLIEGAVATVAVFSAAPMLAVERGNVDLVIFVLLGLSAFMFATHRATVAPFAVLLLAAASKLYPAACLANYVRLRPSRRRIAAIVTACLFAAYLALSLKDLRLVLANTPKPTYLGYGSAVYFELHRAAPELSRLAPFIQSNRQATVVGDVLLLGLFACVALYQWFLPPDPLELPDSNRVSMHAFGAGVAVYVGTFFLGNNWDYRITFLLLTFPQLFLWSRDPSRRRLPSILALALSLIALNGHRLEDAGYPITDEVVNWAVCLALFALYLPTCRLASNGGKGAATAAPAA